MFIYNEVLDILATLPPTHSLIHTRSLHV